MGTSNGYTTFRDLGNLPDAWGHIINYRQGLIAIRMKDKPNLLRVYLPFVQAVDHGTAECRFFYLWPPLKGTFCQADNQRSEPVLFGLYKTPLD